MQLDKSRVEKEFTYSLSSHEGATAVFYKLCRIRWSSRAHHTESVSAMGDAWLAVASSTGWDQKKRNFFDRILCDFDLDLDL